MKYRSLCLLIIAHLISSPSFAGLGEKLQSQLDLFSRTRETWLSENARGQRLDREMWEHLLTPVRPDLRISTEDLAELEQQLLKEIEIGRTESLKTSVLALDRLRKLDPAVIKKFCNELPKGGMLHVHLSGTTNLKTAEKLVSRLNPWIDHSILEKKMVPLWMSQEELAFLQGYAPGRYSDLPAEVRAKIDQLNVLPQGLQSFSRFIALFIIRDDLYKTPENHLQVTETTVNDFLARAKENGLSYIEFTSEPSADFPLVPENIARLEVLVDQWKREFGIDVRMNFSFLRLLDDTANVKLAQNLVKMPSSAITGIDLLGDETATPTLDKAQETYSTILRATRKGEARLKMTMHAGELGDLRNPRDALIFDVDGIGHAVGLRKDPVALRYAMDNQIRIEANILSNLRLGVVRSVKEHPVLDFLRLGLPVSLSTDDEGMFGTVISDEFEALVTQTDVSYSELRKLVENSITSSFAEEATRKQILEKVREDLATFEARWAPILQK